MSRLPIHRHEVLLHPDSARVIIRPFIPGDPARIRLGEIQSFSTRFADFQEPDSTGRSLDVHVHRGFAIYYWEDFADRHIKVFSLRRADA